MADGTLIFETNLDTSGLSTGLGKVNNIASTALKGTAIVAGAAFTAVGAATTAVGAFAKSALDGYAAYEQLAGGVETLFKTSADTVMGYAENAYKTAGMSANQYMETVTSFSASLIQSLGGDTVKAAEVADMAITDMSDNANKMGTSMEMIQNAYNGFAKQNFTMLDNLKLGYGGTKEEMQRLLDDAEKLSGVEYDISSFADIAEAIHVVQVEMGIAGTTAKEASSTIEGSVNSMKASWNNLVVGIADDNADLDSLINQFIDSATTALGNIIPRIGIILTGIGQLIKDMLPIILEMLPELIYDVLPELIESGVSIVDSLLKGITDNLPVLIEMAFGLLMQFTNVILENLPLVLDAGLQAVVQLALGIAQAIPELLPTMVEVVVALVHTIINNLGLVIDAAIEIVLALVDGIIYAIPDLLDAVPYLVAKLVAAIVAQLPKLWAMGVEVVVELMMGIVSWVPQLVALVPELIAAIVGGLKDGIHQIVDTGRDIVEGLWRGISDSYEWISRKLTGWVGDLMSFFKGLLGVESPSKEFALIGKMCVAGFDEGIEPMLDGSEITRSINASVKTLGANTAYGANQQSYGGINQTININREVSTPDEMARAIRLESKYGLMKGVGFA